MHNLYAKVKLNFITSIFSIVFALVGFSYNVWRVQESEHNNTIRLASFKILNELAEFEQVLYASHYDKNLIEGSPRKAWVKIGLISDLSLLISHPVKEKADHLKDTWAISWQKIPHDSHALQGLIEELDSVRKEIRFSLKSLD